MSKKFKNKYRSESIRLQSWDYGWNAAYFVTICTKNRHHFFGKVINGKMQLSDIGKIANEHWLQIPEQFDYAILHNHIVMPDHMHGIVEIAKNNDISSISAINRGSTLSTLSTLSTGSTGSTGSTNGSTSSTGGFAKDKNPMLNKNLSRIIRWYKGVVTFKSRKSVINRGYTSPEFGWHSRFYDSIIRDQKGFERVQQYIVDNPVKWE